jgi:hypothetical protein
VNKLLGDLAGLSARTHAAEQRIRARAVEREAEVAKLLDSASGAESMSDEDGQAYRRLVAERAKLAQVIALADQHLGAA